MKVVPSTVKTINFACRWLHFRSIAIVNSRCSCMRVRLDTHVVILTSRVTEAVVAWAASRAFKLREGPGARKQSQAEGNESGNRTLWRGLAYSSPAAASEFRVEGMRKSGKR